MRRRTAAPLGVSVESVSIFRLHDAVHSLRRTQAIALDKRGVKCASSGGGGRAGASGVPRRGGRRGALGVRSYGGARRLLAARGRGFVSDNLVRPLGPLVIVPSADSAPASQDPHLDRFAVSMPRGEMASEPAKCIFRTASRDQLKGLPQNARAGCPGSTSRTMIEQDDEEATTPLMAVPDEATPLAGGRRRRRLRTGVLATAAAAALMVAAPALDIKKMRRPLAASGAAPTLNRQSLVDPFLKTPHSFKAQNGLKAYSEYGDDDDNDHGDHGDDDDDDDDDYEEYDKTTTAVDLAGRRMGSLEFLVADPVHYIETTGSGRARDRAGHYSLLPLLLLLAALAARAAARRRRAARRGGPEGQAAGLRQCPGPAMAYGHGSSGRVLMIVTVRGPGGAPGGHSASPAAGSARGS